MMTSVNIEWLKRIEEAHNRWDRSRPFGSKHKRCTQQILIDRYFKFLHNKCFKLYIKGEMYYVMFINLIHTVDHEYVYNTYGVSKHLGYANFELELSFLDERCNTKRIVVSYNDILDIKYRAIRKKKFYRMCKKFLVD